MFNSKGKYEFGGEINKNAKVGPDREPEPGDPWSGGYQGWQPIPQSLNTSKDFPQNNPAAGFSSRQNSNGAINGGGSILASGVFNGFHGTNATPGSSDFIPGDNNSIGFHPNGSHSHRVREDSVDLGGLDSIPHTPTDQIPPPLSSLTMHRFGSVSSISTTDDEDATGGPNSIDFPWTESQELLLKETYEELVSDPMTAPFSGRFPPSGIIHRVAKDTIHKARAHRQQFPHSLNSVRRRILILFSKDQDIDANYFPDGVVPEGSRRPFDQHANDLNDEYYDNDDIDHADMTMIAHDQANISLPERLDRIDDYTHDPTDTDHQMESDDRLPRLDRRNVASRADNMTCEEFEFDPSPQSPGSLGPETPKHQSPTRRVYMKYADASAGGPGVLPPDYSRSGLPLASPFKESPLSPQQESSSHSHSMSINQGELAKEDEQNILNIVAKRKRDSLRIKRGVR